MDDRSTFGSEDFSYIIPEETDDLFIKWLGRKTLRCRGRITEVEHHEVFYTKLHKLINSLLRAEPYQFGYQTIEYMLRVEEISDSYRKESADFFLYGNYLGRVFPGDEVEIIATDIRGRKVVKKIFNKAINSQLTPGIQLSALGVRMIVAFLVFGFFAALIGIRHYFISKGILSIVLPVIMIICAFALIKTSVKR
ncbi:MAG: hypothetical protein IKQ44_00755 [Lachnospiraceae bacterium]|nr:hypothetical protein [Lachnospiraceae bacterium]